MERPIGPPLYLVCEVCDHGGHRCGGCGEDIPHGAWACLACQQEFGPHGSGPQPEDRPY